MGFCICSMFCCALLCNHLDGEERAVCFVLLCLSSWCLGIVVWLFVTIPRVCLQFVILVFPDHSHLLVLMVCLETLLPVSLKALLIGTLISTNFIILSARIAHDSAKFSLCRSDFQSTASISSAFFHISLSYNSFIFVNATCCCCE